MCGIAGLACHDPTCSGADHERIVAGMCSLQHHRGPDDEGVVGLGPVCLGASRLAIIDLSPAGHMPMSDPTERWWIAYNGEVYNHRELRRELEGLGHVFRSRTDTEVVLNAFIAWGERCVDRFIGMFAFAIYDRAMNRLVLARDRFGIKPLYYARTAGHVLFGSEIKALVGGGGPAGVDDRRLIEWLLYRNVDAFLPQTLFQGVSAVLPGHLVTISSDGVAPTEVYRATAQVSEGAYGAFMAAAPRGVVDELDETLTDAIRLRLLSDVPVGTLLSGGLDSSLVTAIAARHRRDLTAFHVSVAGFEDLDERRFAETLARSLKLELVTCDLTPESFRRELADAVYHSDLPLSHANSVAYFMISRVAREHGVIVLQSGEGADELFGGYGWNYRRRRRLLKLMPLLRRIPARGRSFAALLAYADQGLPVMSHAFRDTLPPTVEFIDRYRRSAWQAECEAAYAFVPNATDRAVLGAMLSDLGDFLSPLLRRLDRMSMGASVECRVPFLDHRLVHKAINLPLGYRIGRRGDKWILRQLATRYLPSFIRRRRKVGFPLPLAEYLRPLATRAFFEDGFCQQQLGVNGRDLGRLVESWHRSAPGFFGFLTLEIWGRLFILGEGLDRVRERIMRLDDRPSPGT